MDQQNCRRGPVSVLPRSPGARSSRSIYWLAKQKTASLKCSGADYLDGLTTSVLPVSPTGSQTGKRGRDCLPIKQFGPVTHR
jgi:hypothetical protein